MAFIFTCVHSFMNILFAKDISTDAFALLRIIFIGIACLITILFIIERMIKEKRKNP